MNREQIQNLDPIVHAPVRLAVLSILNTVLSAQFTWLKEQTGASDGALSTHLSKLEEHGYISVEKKFVGKKPQTSYSITAKGSRALLDHLEQLRIIIEQQEKINPHPGT
ncbi:MAG: transcriptional regulator [candidate division KSB1 bacterium]|nr:transcriptional regulator [candidate division KSB1 bacterium]